MTYNLIISALFFVVITFTMIFVFLIILHKNELQSLKIKDNKKLYKINQINIYLTAANICLTITIIILTLAISIPYTPFSVIISSPIYPYETTEIAYQTWFSLLRDILPVVIPVAIFSSIYPLKTNQLEVADWFEFWVGFVLGGTFGELFMPLGPVPSLFFIIGFILGPALLVLMVASEDPSSGYAGIFFGFITIPGLTLILQPIGAIFWLSLAIAFGVILGSFYILGTKLAPLILALSIFVVIRFLFSNIFAFIAILLGVTIPLILKLDLKMTQKVGIATISILGACSTILYIASDLAQNLMFAVVFAALLTFGLLFTFEIYVNTIRKVVFKWLLLQLEKSKDKEIDLLKSEIIMGRSKKERCITKESTSFAWLNYAILKPLKVQGFSINIIEEKTDEKSCMKAILVGLKTS